MKWKVRVAGYKNWHIRLGGLGVIEGEEVQEVIEVEAEDCFEAAERAEEEFEKKGYYFDEVVWAEPVKEARP